MRSLPAIATAAVALLGAVPAAAFYLPGSAPHDYAPGDAVDVFVNSLTPTLNTTLKSLVSYDYYDDRFNFCQPKDGPVKQPESRGFNRIGDPML
jgi:transmembrane 9 superfamily protein 2/4